MTEVKCDKIGQQTKFGIWGEDTVEVHPYILVTPLEKFKYNRSS